MCVAELRAGGFGNAPTLMTGGCCAQPTVCWALHVAVLITATVGLNPFGVAVNDRTHTVYVTNSSDGGDLPGTVSVINTATCNGTHTSGCHRRFPVLATGRGPLLIAVDASTSAVYVTDFSGAAVTIVNGSRCDAALTSGCGAAGRQQAIGSEPQDVAINPRTHTVYATNTFQDGSISIFKAIHH